MTEEVYIPELNPAQTFWDAFAVSCRVARPASEKAFPASSKAEVS